MASALLYPLGHPVEFVSNSEQALDAVRAYCRWPQLFATDPLRMQIEVGEGQDALLPKYRAGSGTLELISDPMNQACFHAFTKKGLLHVTRATLARSRWFMFHFLQPWILTSLDMVFFDPLHAACVAQNGIGLVLCGESGAGKTTLAYACARSGWTLVSEEGVHLSRDSQALVGGFWTFRLREPSRALFPELLDLPVGPAPNGKTAISVDATARGFTTAWHCSPSATIFLRRRPGKAVLENLDEDEALPFCMASVSRPDRQTSKENLRTLLRRGCYALEYESLDDALHALKELQ